MSEITLKEYLLDCSIEELFERLMKLDASIMALHQNGFFIVNFDANNIKLKDNELSLSSFNGKIDYLDSGYNLNGDKQDILEMCAIGICAYNGFTSFYTNKEFLAYLISNFDTFSSNGKIPKDLLEYYESVLINGNIDYLNNFMYKKKNENANSNQVMGNSNRLSKSTAIGRAFDNSRESAYVSVLIIPALAVLIYFVILVILFFIDK